MNEDAAASINADPRLLLRFLCVRLAQPRSWATVWGGMHGQMRSLRAASLPVIQMHPVTKPKGVREPRACEHVRACAYHRV